MCKDTDNIQKAKQWVENVLPGALDVEPWKELIFDALPAIIESAYDLRKGHFHDKDIICAFVIDPEGITPANIRKHSDIIERIMNAPVVFFFDNIDSYKAARMAKEGINFVVNDRRIYLPQLLTVVNTRNKATIDDNPITPIAQLLVLYHLDVKDLNGKTTEEIAKLLQTSYPSANRAVRWLTAKGILKQNGKKTKTIGFLYNGKELWNEIEPLMASPIDTIKYTPHLDLSEYGYTAGFSALEHYTMFQGFQPVYAMAKKAYANVKDIISIDPYGEATIQIWKYDPAILAKNGIVDKLSLYLTLRDNDDERVQIELNEMMKGIKW